MVLDALSIETIDLEDVEIALNLAAIEGWNPGLQDAKPFYAADPKGFSIAKINGEPIGCISAVCYDRTFAFIGLYIVKNGWRGKGYGQKIWQAAWQQLGERLDSDRCSIGLDSVVERQTTYGKSGFLPAYRHIRYACEIDPSVTLPKEVVPLAEIPLAQIIRYDAELFPVSRPNFVEPWISVEGGFAYGAIEGSRLKGYGVMRPCRKGFKIGPLFADDRKIAECLFLALISSAKGETVFLDMPDINPEGNFFVRQYNLQPVFTCVRMYCHKIPNIDVNRIFGVTTLELG